MPYFILVKTGDIQPATKKTPEPEKDSKTGKTPEPKPQSTAPPMSAEEEEGLEPSEEQLKAMEDEEDEEAKGLEEIFNISEDQLRRLLS